MKTAVIVTTYNRPDALAAVLTGYRAQSSQDFELLVADDGSTEATRTVVDDCRRHAGFAVHHVWHEDQGFRPAAIRNRAVAASSADYVIFTDGDCVNHVPILPRPIHPARADRCTAATYLWLARLVGGVATARRQPSAAFATSRRRPLAPLGATALGGR